jgi:3-hydroxyacyl-[acyl-carrier-protein] dehydratase
MRLEYFQMIDRVVALNVSERTIRSLCMVPQQSTIFEGHFPNYPLMPGVLLLECMAQTAGWLVVALGGFTSMAFLAAVKEGKFRASVLPGDTLEIEGRVTHEGSGYAMAECEGRRGNKIVCDAKLTFRVLAFPNPQVRQSMLDWAQRIEVPVKEFVK